MKPVRKLKFYSTNISSEDIYGYSNKRNEPLDQTYLKSRLEDELGAEHIIFVPSSPAEISQKIKELFELHYDNGAEELKKNSQIAISGIISPLSQFDFHDLGHIVQDSVPENMIKSMTRFTHPRPLDRESAIIFFQKYLNIPIFESWLFIPGYRKDSMPTDLKPLDFFPLVKPAYDIWINKNKKAWRDEIIYRNRM